MKMRHLAYAGKTNPIQTQSKPIQSQLMPIKYQNKPKTNPIKPSLNFSRGPKSQVFWLLILLTGFSRVSASPIKQAKLWEPVTWNFRNSSYSGNPFDLVVKTSFTHTSSGQKIQTEFFYDSGDTWKLRFTGTHTGRWRFVSKNPKALILSSMA
jgi:hypothetical protein